MSLTMVENKSHIQRRPACSRPDQYDLITLGHMKKA